MKKLSNREKDVLKLICFDNNEIAERLFISIATVKIHLVNISESEEISRIMPVLEAIDKMYAGYGGSKVIIDDVYKCYDIKRDRNVSAKWAFKIRGTDEILVIDNAGDM